eukprot:3417124-Ditylum_brightwellii.AAC.2
MQIAFFAVAKLKKSEQGNAQFAIKTCELLFRGNGHNLPGFMVGRQLCVVSCFFIIVRVTYLNVELDNGNSIFGVSDAAQTFFNMGFLGAVITTILGSITWQLMASAFSLAFLSNPLATVIASGACVLAGIHKRVAGFQHDKVYIGTAEEREAKDLGDQKEETHALAKLSGFTTMPEALAKLMSQDPSVKEFVRSISITNIEVDDAV